MAAGLGCLALLSACGGSEPARPSILLVTLDTTRADRLGCYGRADAGTPHLDALAARGLVAERALAPVPLTLPSHTTLLTGLEPPVHGVRDNGLSAVPDAAVTLAEELSAAGLRSAAFVSAYPLSATFGLDQGFEVYDDRFGAATTGDAPGAMHERKGDATVDRALTWLDTLGDDEPFFAWVHLFDPHYPLLAPEPFASRFRDDPYQAEVAFADAQVGRLADWLERRGRTDRTLVVVTADHGEGLGDHGEVSHGNLLYDTTQHVPLILAGPEVEPGVRMAGSLGLSDVAATLRVYGGAAAGASASGRGEPLPLDGSPVERTVYLETLYPRIHFGWSELFGIERSGWKYVEAPGAAGGSGASGAGELWPVGEEASGPGQAESERARALASELATLRDELEARALTADAAEADLAALEALGYVGVDVSFDGEAEDGITPGLDPRRVIHANTAGNLLRSALGLGDLEAAELQLATVRELDPGGLLDLESTGFLELARGLRAPGGGRDDAALGRALASFQAATSQAPGRRGLWQKLAEVHLALDEPEPAFLAATHAARLAPPPESLVQLVATLRGRLESDLTAARTRGDGAAVARLEELLTKER